MNDTLRQELDRVTQRIGRYRRSAAVAIAAAVLIGIGLAALIYARRHGQAVPAAVVMAMLVAAVVSVVSILTVLRRATDAGEIARRLERQFPDLDKRLLTAIEQTPDAAKGRLNYFQERVVDEAVEHARGDRWLAVVSPRAMAAAVWGQRLTLVGLAVVFVLMLTAGPRRSATNVAVVAIAPSIAVEPGDTSVERSTSLLVLARFTGQLPGDVRLLTKSAAGAIETAAMSKSLDDPLFAARVPSVNDSLQYAVQYNGTQTAWFKAGVFEFPELKQADADLKFPGYTKLADRRVEDVRSVTAVEGTKATIVLRLNKPVADAELRPANGEPIKLTADPKQPDVVSATIDLKQSQTMKLNLVDADGRQNKQPAVELTINVNPNRPPELKPVTPGRDVDVSPIQELGVGVRAWDDFGLLRVGLTYGIAGQPTEDVILAADVPGGEKRDVSQTLSLERLKAEPDQLLSYYFWAEDFAADGSVRRTAGDMYFAEVRPFEEIFRQGEQPSAGEQQQQQQQQGQQGGGQGQQAEELAELQKQIIAATWKIVRRETTSPPTAAFVPDVTLVGQSQSSAREQAAALEEKLTDAKSRGYLKSVLDHMDRAVMQLAVAGKGGGVSTLSTALASEQAAYQALLRLRAREFEVVRGNQRQQQQGQSASSSSSRRQQQLDQLSMEQDQNRYESQRTAAAAQADNPQQRETRQVLSRLKELAQRQEDLNRQMQELKSALEQARDEKKREELQQQLARLRDQQAQQLRDTDELRDRMDRPENQEQMAEARQQLEQTRENVRRASEALQQEKVPEAVTSGARAGEQFDNLREQVRRGAANQLSDAMTDLRDNARALDDKQQQLSEQLKKLNTDQKPSLRDGDDRKQLADQLGQQKQSLDKVLDTMRKTVEAAEGTEPLVSKQLYDTLRQAGQKQTDQALDVSRQLLDRGFTNEAKQAEGEAAKGIAQLRQGVEQAATGVLGDEAESLRRARAELDRLASELQREVDRNRPAGATADGRANGTPTTRPGGQFANNQSALNAPTTRPAGAVAGRSPATRPAGQLALGGNDQRRDQRGATSQPGDRSRDAQSRQSGDADQAGTPSQQGGLRGDGRPQGGAGANQPSNGERGQSGEPTPSQTSQSGQGDRPDEQPGQPPQPGQGRQAAQGGQRPGDGEPSNQPGERPGEANQPGGAGDQAGQPGQAGQQPGQPGQGTRPGEQRGQGGQGLAGRRQPGERTPSEADQPNRPGEQVQPQREPAAGRPSGNGQPGGGGSAGDPNARSDGRTGAGIDDATGPLTGDNFREWSDRLRDVEEMVTDPKLRERAARIRERARDLRAELKRHSKQPNWDMVQQTVGTPLAELRDQVAQELLRRTKPEALVPLDREAVPPQYAEQVRQYYERLGAGR